MRKNIILKNIILSFMGFVFFGTAIVIVVYSQMKLPDFNNFLDYKISNSTKIYDRTGTVVLYDLQGFVRRTEIPFSEMGENIKKATIAVEDDSFYSHSGIRPKSIVRAVIANIRSGRKTQGGSTITQQVVKNALLTRDKALSRKLKEWVLAIRIENSLSKDQILEVYLNQNPYGGVTYGVFEGSQALFGKEPKNLTIAESAYMAAIPKGPSIYSPYGENRQRLEDRKNYVLKRMLDTGAITEEEYKKAIEEKVVFAPVENRGIKAPHFVFFIQKYISEKYGEESVENGGLSVYTTLDYDLQKRAEEILKSRALESEKSFEATNQALVAMDPKTGQILAMVGSRDYFDKNIDGAYNVATAKRQPGSSFKPFVYAKAFEKGYTPKTVLFDVKTEFSTTCPPWGNESDKNCYSPENFDGLFRGPMTLRDALQQSINVPAVKTLYLVGINETIKFSGDIGVELSGDKNQYGLSLVLGGGEVSLVDMVHGYSTLANYGGYIPKTAILRIVDSRNNILEEYKEKEPNQVISRDAVKTLSNVLSDNNARIPTFGSNSALHIPGFQVAAKTGTTNNNRDAWLIGYTPNIAVGVWAGNNDNKPMKKGGAAIAGPSWNDFMRYALSKYPPEIFEEPAPIDNSIAPVLRGSWMGNDSKIIDSRTGLNADQNTPNEFRKEIINANVHSILYWIDKDNPLGPKPSNPNNNPMFRNWEYAVTNWWERNKNRYGNYMTLEQEKNVSETKEINILSDINSIISGGFINLEFDFKNFKKVNKTNIFFNGKYIGQTNTTTFRKDISGEKILDKNSITLIVDDSDGTSFSKTIQF